MVSAAKGGRALTYAGIVLLLALAAACLAVSTIPYGELRSQLDGLSLHGNASAFTPGLHEKIVLLLRVAAGALLLASLALYWQRQQVAQTASLVLNSLAAFFSCLAKDWARTLRNEDRLHLGVLAGIIVVACTVRIAFLFQPMRYDEAYTYTHYASTPFYLALSNYSAPNNHLFHTALVRLAYLLFGDDPWALRLPALTAGILLVPATYVAIRTHFNRDAALLSTGLVASSSVLIEFSTNARGYSLLCLFFVVALALARQLPRSADIAPWLLFSLLSALGFYTVPTMLYPFGALVLWLLLSMLASKPPIGRDLMVRRLVMSVCLAGLVTAVLYSPVLLVWGPGAIIGNGFVAPKPWSQVIASLPRSAGAVWSAWNAGMFIGTPVLMTTGFVASLAFHNRISTYRVPVVIAALLWIVPVVLAQRVVPYGRVWVFLLPLYLGLAAVGLAHLWNTLVPGLGGLKRSLFPLLALGVSILLAGNVVATQSVYWSEDTGTLRDGELIAAWMEGNLETGDAVLAASPADGPLEYHFRRLGLNAEAYWYSARAVDGSLGSVRRIVVVVKEPGQTLESLLARLGANRDKYTEGRLVQKYSGASLYEIVPKEDQW